MHSGRLIAAALLRQHMDHDRAVHPHGAPDDLLHAQDIMSVYRPQVFEPHVLEDHAGRHHQFFQRVLGVIDGPDQGLAALRTRKHFLHTGLQVVVALGGTRVGEKFCDAADITGNGHLVVVEDDDEIGPERTGIVQRLIRFAAGKRAVSDHGNDFIVFPFEISCAYQTEPCRKAGRRMSGIEGIIGRFIGLWKARHAAEFAEMIKAVHSAGQQFPGIALMADVKNQFILREVKTTPKSQRQFHRTQVGRQMPAFFGDPVQ